MNYLYLFFISFLSATLLPFGSEALLIYNFTLNQNIYYLILFATLGNSLGSIFNYLLGYKGEEYLISKKILTQKKLFQSKYYFDKYGLFIILLSWMPIIGDPITVVAGVLRYNIYKFIALVLVAKFARYIFVAIGYFYFQ
ncbi:MAG: YqaA family protein [Campylobacterota bacterium]|nr:YqaA family protein [Campylobacterota bacterium]